MYNDFFGFRDQPFNATPDPHIFYTPPSYQRIYDSLVHSIREGKSLSILTGEVGTGKTTMLRRIMRDLEGSVQFAYFMYTTLPFDDLLRFICEDLGVPPQQEGKLYTLQTLQEFLLRHDQGQPAALLIDEAQNLQEEVLEEIQQFLNLTTEGKALLPVILAGQPELEKRLAQPTVDQLKQRVTLSCKLDRLNERDIGPFIIHRLQAAACARVDIFSPEAIRRIAVHSRGIPRLINILCDNALLLGYSFSEKIISAAMIEEISQELRLPKSSSVQLENREAPPEEKIVFAQAAPIAPQEEKISQLHTPLANTSLAKTSISKGRMPQRGASANAMSTGNPSRRTSLRWFALAGTGLAFALWFFTLFPYGKGDYPFVPPILSAKQNKSVSSNVNDHGTGSLVRTELDTMSVRPDVNKSHLPTGREASPEKKNRQEESAQMKEEQTPMVATQSTISPAVHTDSQEENSIKELTDENLLDAPEQQPQAYASDASASHEFVLLEAASQGDVAKGESLLSAGIIPDVTDERGWTALMMATVHGYSPMVELLLKKGADVNRHNATGGTALMMAAIQGQNEILQLLLDRGAKVNIQDIKGWTALMYAARNGHTATVQILLSSGAEADLKNVDGRTALMHATARGHQETVRALQNGKAGGTTFN